MHYCSTFQTVSDVVDFEDDACLGKTVVLKGPSGEFGPLKVRNSLEQKCRWMIQVGIGKVGLEAKRVE